MARVPGLYKRGNVWWCKYYVNGRLVAESTKTAKGTEAKRFLDGRRGRVATGQPIMPRAARIGYEDVEKDLRAHYMASGLRDLGEYTYRVAHLTEFFDGRRIATIGQPDVDAYTTKCQTAGAMGSTVRRELGTLRRMLRLAYENGKLLRLPILHLPKDGAPRMGFFERDQYNAVRRHLCPDVAAAIAYTFGWRTQSEVLVLERRQLDLAAGTLRLDPGTTKNDEGRIVYLTPDLKRLLEGQLERVEALQKRLGRIVPYLFLYLTGKKRAGERRRDYRKAWGAACKAAGISGRYRHDFRRTAVRNMVNAGVPERVAMKISGHKTRAVFDRYHIAAPADLQEAAARLVRTDASGETP